MIRKLFVLIAALGLVAGACGGSDSGSAGSCAAVADDAMSAVQDVINEFDALTLDEMTEMGDEEPAFLTDFENKMDELQGVADDLGCSDAEMEELFADRVDNLTAEGMFGELMIDELKAGNFFD